MALTKSVVGCVAMEPRPKLVLAVVALPKSERLLETLAGVNPRAA